MAERKGTAAAPLGQRAALKAKATEQAAAASEASIDDGPAPKGASRGLVGDVAALIAGKEPAKAKQPAADDDDGADDGADDDDQPQARGKAGPDDEEDDDDGGAEDDDGDGGADPDGKPASLDDVAKRLGMTRQELNAIPVQVGAETMTLGELKAKLPALLKLDENTERLEDDRGQWELERVGAYRNLQALIDQLPRNAMTQGLLRQLEAQHESSRERELESLQFARPRWSDPAYATGARQKMTALAREYGFTQVEVASVMDHRQVLLLQDYAELREKVKSSRDMARKVNEPDGSRNAGQGAPARASRGDQSSNGRRTKDTQAVIASRVGAMLRKR